MRDSIETLLQVGIRQVELSGGTQPYPSLFKDLEHFQEISGIEFLVHNYFPPPKRPFVVNLASSNSTVRRASMNLAETAVEIASRLGVREYGVHSGFRLDINHGEIGKQIEGRPLLEKEHAVDIFQQSLSELIDFASTRGVTIYIENNVLSSFNLRVLGPSPFLGLLGEDIIPIVEEAGCGLILDLAHLFVTCRSLGVCFEDEVVKLSRFSDYIHISETLGFEDENAPLTRCSRIVDSLALLSQFPKYITIESHGNVESIVESKSIVRDAITPVADVSE